MLLRYTLLWLPLPFIGIFNGILRQFGYSQFVGELTAHQISSLTGILLFGAYTWIVEKKWPLSGNAEALQIGAIWLIITILFEFIFGHYVVKHSWEHLLSDYNILAGRVWGVVLIVVFFLPYIVFTLQHRKEIH